MPKLTDAGEAATVPSETPVPLSGTTKSRLVALLTTPIAPLAGTAMVGAKVAVSCFEAPPAKVKGVDTVAIENPVPDTETLETVTLPGPVFVRVTVCDRDVLTLTFPKLTDVGEAVTVPFRCEGTISTAA